MAIRIGARRHRATGPLLALTLVFIALPAFAKGSGGHGIPEKVDVETLEGGAEILRFARSVELERTIEALRVRNLWGDVRVRRSPVNAVGLSFVVQRLSSDSPLPNIDAEAKESRVEVRIDYPGDPTRSVAVASGLVASISSSSRRPRRPLTSRPTTASFASPTRRCRFARAARAGESSFPVHRLSMSKVQPEMFWRDRLAAFQDSRGSDPLGGA